MTQHPASIVLFAVVLASSVANAQRDTAAIKSAVEARFQQLAKTSTVKVTSVAVPNRPKVGNVLEIALQPPTTEKFEFHAETAFALIWQALTKAQGSFKQLARVQLTLTHAPRTLVIDCPVKMVEDSYGYVDFGTLKRQCQMK
jgi:hypothetical protein